MLLSDYLTKSGREESGGLLGAYFHSSTLPFYKLTLQKKIYTSFLSFLNFVFTQKKAEPQSSAFWITTT